jgi:hypothetical protein
VIVVVDVPGQRVLDAGATCDDVQDRYAVLAMACKGRPWIKATLNKYRRPHDVWKARRVCCVARGRLAVLPRPRGAACGPSRHHPIIFNSIGWASPVCPQAFGPSSRKLEASLRCEEFPRLFPFSTTFLEPECPSWTGHLTGIGCPYRIGGHASWMASPVWQCQRQFS